MNAEKSYYPLFSTKTGGSIPEKTRDYSSSLQIDYSLFTGHSINQSSTPEMQNTKRHICFWLTLVVAFISSFAFSSVSCYGAEEERKAFFGKEQASRDVRIVADWSLRSQDHEGVPFVILDKREAKLFVFNSNGRLLGAAPALLGAAVGDKDFEGVGNKTLENIPPEQRITPAGRYVGWGGTYLAKGKYFWISYKAGLAIHAVVNPPGQRRLERIVSPDPAEHRISWGCINVPTKFFNGNMRRVFAATNGIVYILPETQPASEFFGITGVNSIVSGNK